MGQRREFLIFTPKRSVIFNPPVSPSFGTVRSSEGRRINNVIPVICSRPDKPLGVTIVASVTEEDVFCSGCKAVSVMPVFTGRKSNQLVAILGKLLKKDLFYNNPNTVNCSSSKTTTNDLMTLIMAPIQQLLHSHS